MYKLSNYEVTFQEIDLSQLLGITHHEFSGLLRSPLYQYKNEEGELKEYFMHVSPQNRPEVLAKIQRKSDNLVTFVPEDIFELRRNQFSIANKAASSFPTMILTNQI